MKEIAFAISASIASNDHQVRILIDGQDLISRLDQDMLGIDPADFFANPSLCDSGRLIVARCGCGVVGCGDVSVRTTHDRDLVVWDDFCNDELLDFSRHQFYTAVAAAKSNRDWETTERTAERLIAEMDFTHFMQQGLKFSWASGRCDDKSIVVCFYLHSDYQILVRAPWDHRSAESALTAILIELVKSPNEWSDVAYYPQGLGLSKPDIAGKSWRRG